MGDHDFFAVVVAKHLECYRHPDPVPITKKLKELLIERPMLNVVGIRRRDAFCELATGLRYGVRLEMTWSEEWHAWSCRPAVGFYQQIIVFVPRESEE